ncbi:class I SAM-dependent methyltransferase [Synechococcus sp. MIT S1220]|uniref:class I SAM-dependent methyltransferase n=1 Tax=Synechococcus sp. MIT S1220 TaxID=3082549 RepID=UPI0039AFD772
MEPKVAACPAWLAHHLQQAGGVVTFRQFMDWVLNDPDHGYYGSGKACIGPQGDFVTSPSLGSDFAALLARQLADWIGVLQARSGEAGRLSIVDVGPGEGHLAADLIVALAALIPDLGDVIELILVERNPGMMRRQQQRLACVQDIPIRWCSLEELHDAPIRGVILAHELLDALPVDRLILRQQQLWLQGVALDANGVLKQLALPLSDAQQQSIELFQQDLGVPLPPDNAEDGWTSEWHVSLEPWLAQAGAALEQGVLLVIDYALEARRYYTRQRAEGTLLAYSAQQGSKDWLHTPGQQDLTAHLCIESLTAAAVRMGWTAISSCRQGEALLALGLAERLHSLQSLDPSQLATAFQRREALLRLVDPAGLGEFRWLLYGKEIEIDLFKLSEPRGCG